MPLMKKELFFNVSKKVPMATKPRRGRGGGAKGLSDRATKKITFFLCGFTYNHSGQILEVLVRRIYIYIYIYINKFLCIILFSYIIIRHIKTIVLHNVRCSISCRLKSIKPDIIRADN